MTAEERRRTDDESVGGEKTAVGDRTSDTERTADCESATDEDVGAHLRDVPAGSGCTEIWEHLAERREDDG